MRGIGGNSLVLDTETNGFDWYRGDLPFLLGTYQLDGKAQTILQLDQAPLSARSGIAAELADVSLPKIGHNIKFDIHMLREAGFAVKGRCFDTMVLAHLAGEERLGLKKLAAKLLRMDASERDEVDKWLAKEKRVRRRDKDGRPEPTFRDVPRATMIPYLKKDLVMTRRLFIKLWEKLYPRYKSLIDLESDVLDAVIEIERIGMKVDVPYLSEKILEYETRVESIEVKLREHCPADTNFDSPKQLQEILYGTLGLPIYDRTPSGQPATGAGILSRLDHPFATLLMRRRSDTKLLNTYFRGICGKVDSDGILHPNFRQNGAVTGRFSCVSPNLQNIPRSDRVVRVGFTSHNKDRMLVFADYSQIEIRLLAHYANDTGFLNGYRAGVDVHTETARLIFGKTREPYRQIAKTLNFLIIYGGGARKLHEAVNEELRTERGGDTGFEFTLADSEDALGTYHQRKPRIRGLMRSLEGEVRAFGYVEDIYGKRYYPPRNRTYAALNYLIQGTAAQILKRGLVRLHQNLALDYPDVHIVNQIHDEFIIDIPQEIWYNSDVRQMLREVLEDRQTFRVPITISLAQSEGTWADKTSV